MSLIEIFFERRGRPSLKRIVGSIMLFDGIIGKTLLCVYATLSNKDLVNFNDVDNSLDGFLYGGVALLFGSIADKFSPKNWKNGRGNN